MECKVHFVFCFLTNKMISKIGSIVEQRITFSVTRDDDFVGLQVFSTRRHLIELYLEVRCFVVQVLKRSNNRRIPTAVFIQRTN